MIKVKRNLQLFIGWLFPLTVNFNIIFDYTLASTFPRRRTRNEEEDEKESKFNGL